MSRTYQLEIRPYLMRRYVSSLRHWVRNPLYIAFQCEDTVSLLSTQIRLTAQTKSVSCERRDTYTPRRERRTSLLSS